MLLSLRRGARRRRPRAEHDSRKLDQPVAEVLAEVAHEMSQPLAAAHAAFVVLKETTERTDDDAERQRAWAVLERQFQRLSRLVDDLTQSTRQELTAKQLRIERLDLRQVVRETVDAVRPQIAARRQRLELELPGPLWVDGDWVRLQQVLSNLLLNAVKFTPEGGAMAIRLIKSDGLVHVIVSDTGDGIPAALLPRLFERFVTAGPQAARGMGVGLAVARELVERHGGTIRATSRGAGHGSEFAVSLPVRTDDVSPDAMPHTTAPGDGHRHP